MRCDPPAGGRGARFEYVVAVDGRDTQTNQDARADLPGVVSSGPYTCRGFQISRSEARAFTCVAAGNGETTAERAGSPASVGLVAVAAWPERGRPVLRQPRGADPLDLGPLGSGTGWPTRGERPRHRLEVVGAVGHPDESVVTCSTAGAEVLRATRSARSARSTVGTYL